MAKDRAITSPGRQSLGRGAITDNSDYFRRYRHLRTRRTLRSLMTWILFLTFAIMVLWGATP
jgi:hypothetical protein